MIVSRLAQLARRAAGVAAVAVLVITGATTTANAASDVPDRRIRVATFNIHHAQGVDDKLNLERVADVIRTGEADIVGLQEVDRHWSERSEFADQASWLAERLRMHVVYGANLDLDPLTPGAPRRQYGTAILSRYPVLDWDNTLLPRYEGHEQRGLLRARIQVRGVPVQVFNTHLQHNDANERLEQVRAIQPLVAREEPVVLAGDLNARPDAPEIRALSETLTDAWPRAGRGDGYTYPATGPNARIDYVFTSPDVRVESAAVVQSDASDHLPLFVDLLVGRHG
ncbi:endonuclease/exonuclease/phosphatase family metal-dependent hydrolase [Nonomuraea polychroma]|uniref:Endonuclease/exonuclease/phosphatase family metal-dependent hydrolase n=1 Tax=Nonomuraea polychroma TaxID=46176 RepID=A0A438MAB5_9ACTN|nr:endonuclease/exonuclease/phosphatase family protein [Nonomuraea polychroma]RVX42663.1 endonuclease/exonuclease/phosphatase family metal-dependent hydrolase [Nonomuraea polychroma]